MFESLIGILDEVVSILMLGAMSEVDHDSSGPACKADNFFLGLNGKTVQYSQLVNNRRSTSEVNCPPRGLGERLNHVRG